MDIDAVLTQMRDLGLLVDSIDTSGKLVRVPVTYPRPDKARINPAGMWSMSSG